MWKEGHVAFLAGQDAAKRHCGSPVVQRDSGSLLAWQGPRGKRWNSLELPEDRTYPKRQLHEEPPMWVSGEYEGGKRIQNGTGMIHGGVRTSLMCGCNLYFM